MTKQMTPLRQRMIEDMTIRNMSPSTQKIYVAAVANFSIFHGRPPDKLTFEDAQQGVAETSSFREMLARATGSAPSRQNS